jgi:predicted ATP-grasp superfamily ATP-dependent carboligase
MSNGQLPAVVLGIDTPIGLSIVRELGKRGVAVHGLARDEGAIGLSSRYLRRGMLRATGEAELIRQLAALRRELGEACLFAISESDIALLNRHRDRLSGYRLMFADAERMQRVLNKETTYATAARVGIRTPRTVYPRSLADGLASAQQLGFPVILKWADPNLVVKRLSAAGLSCDKARYCYSAEELGAYLRQFEPLGIYPMLQEFCGGYGLGQFILMKDGQPCYTFQHRRLHEWPPEGGVSTLCESLAPGQHDELMQRSVALLRALQWEGVAMVEYRHDPATGASALMEVNGRFWGSLSLACRAGASFPWLAYQLFGLDQPVSQQPYRAGLRCRYMVPETKRLMRILFRQKHIANRALSFARGRELISYLADFFRPSTRYFVFQFADPMPLLRDMVHMLRSRRDAAPEQRISASPMKDIAR